MTTANEDVILICTLTEKIVRSTPNLQNRKNILNKLMNSTKVELPLTLFKILDKGGSTKIFAPKGNVKFVCKIKVIDVRNQKI